MRITIGMKTPWSSDKKYKRLERLHQSLWLRLGSFYFGAPAALSRHATSRYFGYPISRMTGGSYHGHPLSFPCLVSLLFCFPLTPLHQHSKVSCVLLICMHLVVFGFAFILRPLHLITYFAVPSSFSYQNGLCVYIDSFTCTNTKIGRIHILINCLGLNLPN